MDDFNNNLNGLAKSINIYSSLIFKVGATLVILSAFFLFTNLFSEMYDTPKFLVLLGTTAVLLLFLAIRFTVAGKVALVRTPLDIPLLLLLAVAVVSTILSASPYVALLGDQLRVHGSLISLVALILFYFVLINNLKNAKETKWLLMVTVIASQVLAAVTLLAYMGIKLLPPPWIQGVNFTPTGSSFTTTAVLALLLPFIVIQILSTKKPLFIILNSLFLSLSGLTIALTGTWATWIGALVGVSLVVFLSDLRNLSNLSNLGKVKPLNLIGLITPVAIVILVTVLSVVPPMGGAKNPLYTQAQNFPREIQLSFPDTWKVSISAFRDSPFWGTGPTTYAFNFTNYKPAEFNASKFWNLRFDSAFNEYLQVLANLGGIGLLALLSLTALFVSSAYKTLVSALRSRGSELPTTNYQLQTPLAISGLIFFIILALHTSTAPLWIMGILILAAFMTTNLTENLQRSWGSANSFKGMFLRIAGLSATGSSTETIKVDALPGILLVIVIALVLFTGFFGGKMVLADYHHRLALNAISQNQGIVAYNELVAAEKLNPYSDVYRTDLAQTNFALANAIAAAKGPTEASPAGSLTDQDKQNIQVLLQQSINEGRIAVTLSPRSSLNWEILALLYRQIAGVAQNALVFSLDSYGRAIMQDPLNPVLRVNVGGVYYAIKSYDMAVRFFTDAINLKPDYANAYYNLSVALKDKGDLANAEAIAEKLLTLLDKNSQDYKTANEYLTDLKGKTASTNQPPAASASGALQKQELPKVIDLPKPEKIATPEAIKASPTPAPTASTTPTASPTANP